jgi:hypothetical protein
MPLDSLPPHLGALIDRLNRRRLDLLGQGLASPGRRIDEVDELFTFPSTVSALCSDTEDRESPLNLYLKELFANRSVGKYDKQSARKRLFVRGIYLASSKQEGNPLNTDVADFYGIHPEDLPEATNVKDSKIFFLKDLVSEKIFLESDLVTSSTDIRETYRRWQMISIGVASFAVLVMCLVIYSLTGGLKQSVTNEADAFRALAGSPPSSLTLETVEHQLTLSRTVASNLTISAVFKPLYWMASTVYPIGNADRQKKQEELFRKLLLDPMFSQLRSLTNATSTNLPLIVQSLLQAEQAAEATNDFVVTSNLIWGAVQAQYPELQGKAGEMGEAFAATYRRGSSKWPARSFSESLGASNLTQLPVLSSRIDDYLRSLADGNNDLKTNKQLIETLHAEVTKYAEAEAFFYTNGSSQSIASLSQQAAKLRDFLSSNTNLLTAEGTSLTWLTSSLSSNYSSYVATKIASVATTNLTRVSKPLLADIQRKLTPMSRSDDSFHTLQAVLANKGGGLGFTALEEGWLRKEPAASGGRFVFESRIEGLTNDNFLRELARSNSPSLFVFAAGWSKGFVGWAQENASLLSRLAAPKTEIQQKWAGYVREHLKQMILQDFRTNVLRRLDDQVPDITKLSEPSSGTLGVTPRISRLAAKLQVVNQPARALGTADLSQVSSSSVANELLSNAIASSMAEASRAASNALHHCLPSLSAVFRSDLANRLGFPFVPDPSATSSLTNPDEVLRSLRDGEDGLKAFYHAVAKEDFISTTFRSRWEAASNSIRSDLDGLIRVAEFAKRINDPESSTSLTLQVADSSNNKLSWLKNTYQQMTFFYPDTRASLVFGHRTFHLPSFPLERLDNRFSVKLLQHEKTAPIESDVNQSILELLATELLANQGGQKERKLKFRLPIKAGTNAPPVIQIENFSQTDQTALAGWKPRDQLFKPAEEP